MDTLRQRVADTVHNYVSARLTVLGKSGGAFASSTDLFDERVLDSVALTGLIAAVEQATGGQIDFIDVDPDALGTIDGIVEELSRVVKPR